MTAGVRVGRGETCLDTDLEKTGQRARERLRLFAQRVVQLKVGRAAMETREGIVRIRDSYFSVSHERLPTSDNGG